MRIYTSVGELLSFHQGLSHKIKCIDKIRGRYSQNKCLDWELTKVDY
jgi:hypothetical protein